MSSAPKKTEPQLNFEAAMDRLERNRRGDGIRQNMLEELIGRYEEGMKLVKICQERLANAGSGSRSLLATIAGKAVVKNFEPASEKETPAAEKE